MAKKKTMDELADEILRDFDAGDTPARRAQTALQQALDAGDCPLRQEHLRRARRLIAEIDPRREPKLVQQLQTQVLALQGRGGDLAVAHVTPGETVLPAWAQTPELMNYLANLARLHGVDPARYQVGSGRNRINPRTGLMEFADLAPGADDARTFADPSQAPTSSADSPGSEARSPWDPRQYLPDYGRAREIADEELELHHGHNDADDALRHADWSRRMQTEIGPFTSWSAGTLHEVDNLLHGGPWRESMMDLHNNAEGRSAASQNRSIDPNNLRINPRQTRGRY
jgi:hypothetical protein